MKRLPFFLVFVIACALGAKPQATLDHALAVSRTDDAVDEPNIILILADDLGIGDPRCYNPNSKIPTPNMDRMAREGMRLTDAHSPSAVCTPTRYGLLTGRYCWRSRLKSGVLGNGYARSLIEPGRATIASFMRDRGYHTACIGKWHLGLDWASTDGQPVNAGSFEHIDYSAPLIRGADDVGFDESLLITASLDMAPYCYVKNDRVPEAPTDRVLASRHRRQNGNGYWRGGAATPGFDHTDVLPTLQHAAIDYLDQRAARPETPFLLYLPLTAPHTPWVPTDAFAGRTEIAHYGDFVAQVDAMLGALLDRLDQHGLAENTIVIFTSDNGAHWPDADIERWEHDANNGYRGQKADIFEGGHRVPCLIRWPGHIAAGATSDALLSLTDWFATLGGILGEPIPTGAAEDSIDQSAVLLGGGESLPRTSMVQHSHRGVFAVRSGNWKLILGDGSGGFTQPAGQRLSIEEAASGQLYNLRADPAETSNVIEQHPEIVSELIELLRTIRLISDH